MSKHLVVVESVSKTKSIGKFLGKDYDVKASYGHVRDLIPKNGAVDPDNHFAMRYETIARNAKHVDALIKAMGKCDSLYLAPDPDREGEAIAWHIYELLNARGVLKGKKVYRISFNQITKRAVQEAISAPREISMSLVNAQQARRALDYLVGFNLSPLLWRKITRGLSAGRVQSPALHMIVTREREIQAFEPKEYWTIHSDHQIDETTFPARLIQYQGKKVEQFSFTGETQAQEAVNTIKQAANGSVTVQSVTKRERKRKPSPPFITSTLQQESVRKLGFTAQRTMRTAQQLYEGVDLGEGVVGLITYMRTDSINLADEAIANIRSQIKIQFGADKCPQDIRTYVSKVKNAQEAHEGIRPTDISRTPDSLKNLLEPSMWKLYDLIWKRTMASQMIDARINTVTADMGVDDHLLRASGSTVIEPGFMAVYREGTDDKKQETDEKFLPPLTQGQSVPITDIKANQHFTEPPPRYNEASLVKRLEEYGIGRPSTYAAIIATLLQRDYVSLDGKRFIPSDVGCVVSDFLNSHFSQYVDYDFTADLENQLDEVANGNLDWEKVLNNFWQPFHTQIKSIEENVSRAEALQSRELGIHPKTGKPISVRIGRFGPFVQHGSSEDTDKPQFVGIPPGASMDTMTFEQALKLLQLPRELGQSESGDPVSIGIGRYGPFVKIAKAYASLPAEHDPYSIDLSTALTVFEEQQKAKKNKVILEFKDAGIQVLRGRYGPYVTDGEKNGRIPKDEEPSELDLERCQELLSQAKGKRRPKKTKK